MSDPTLGKVLNALALRYFQEAAAAGSFRQAAERIRVAASAIHRQVALLEAQALYRRSGYREVAPFNDEPYAHHWFEKRI